MLSVLAELGEFIGGVAVLVTIVYFAIQLRANLNANRAQALATWTATAQSEKEAIYRDPEFARIYQAVVLGGNQPEGEEQLRFYAYCIQFMNSWQLLHAQCKLGVVDNEFLEHASIGYIGFACTTHVLTWWKSMGAEMYSPAFVEFVNARVQPPPNV